MEFFEAPCGLVRAVDLEGVLLATPILFVKKSLKLTMKFGNSENIF
jgi:hypothetical protein